MPKPNEPILVALVLAAGSSRRFGSDKRLFAFHGTPLLQRSLVIPIQLGLATTVVLKPTDELFLPSLLGCYLHHPLLKVVYADDALLGMGHSLSAGIRSILQSSKSVEGALVFLADMPSLEVKTVRDIIRRFDSNKIVVPTYMATNGSLKAGHPVLFSRPWLKQLQKLSGDNGAKELLKKNPENIINVALDDKGIFLDIDHPAEVPGAKT